MEQKILLGLLKNGHSLYKRYPKQAEKLIATGRSKPPSTLNPSELAAWTGVARAILSTNETMTRN